MTLPHLDRFLLSSPPHIYFQPKEMWLRIEGEGKYTKKKKTLTKITLNYPGGCAGSIPACWDQGRKPLPARGGKTLIQSLVVLARHRTGGLFLHLDGGLFLQHLTGVLGGAAPLSVWDGEAEMLQIRPNQFNTTNTRWTCGLKGENKRI